MHLRKSYGHALLEVPSNTSSVSLFPELNPDALLPSGPPTVALLKIELPDLSSAQLLRQSVIWLSAHVCLFVH